MPDGAPPSGTPGGHIGEHLTFASCRRCGAEWVWIGAGVPSTMRNCGCPDENVVTVDFRAVRHGYLSDKAMGDPIDRDELLRQIEERRSDKAFMARLRRIIHESADVLERLRDASPMEDRR